MKNSPLRKFRRSSGLTTEKFGGLIGVTGPHVSKLERGLSVPSLDLALQIEAATQGAVPVAAWREVITALRTPGAGVAAE